LSNQFKLKKYLGLTDDEIRENEELWAQENAVDRSPVAGEESADPGLGLGNMGIRPEADDVVDLEAEPDLGDIEAEGGDMEMGADAGGAPMAPVGGEGTV